MWRSGQGVSRLSARSRCRRRMRRRALAARGVAQGLLYVTFPQQHTIRTYTLGGQSTLFIDLSAHLTVGNNGPFWPTFDVVGDHGCDLFVDEDGAVSSKDRIFRITPAKSVSAASTTLGEDADGLAFDPFTS